jgi:hypothetical protein
MECISDKRCFKKLSDLPAGHPLLIHSSYPLDDIFQHGLELMGYQVAQVNQIVQTSNPDANRLLQGHYLTSVVRQSIRSDANELMFQNFLQPAQTAMHALGQYSRAARNASTETDLFHSIQRAIDWLVFIENRSILPPEQFRQVKEQFLGRLAVVEAQKLANFGVEPQTINTQSGPVQVVHYSRLFASDKISKPNPLRQKQDVQFKKSASRQQMLVR